MSNILTYDPEGIIIILTERADPISISRTRVFLIFIVIVSAHCELLFKNKFIKKRNNILRLTNFFFTLLPEDAEFHNFGFTYPNQIK